MLHFGKIPKKIDHNLAKIDFKIQQNPDNFWKKLFKKSARFSAIFNEKLSLENGAKECIV
jgi:hypothetical protein